MTPEPRTPLATGGFASLALAPAASSPGARRIRSARLEQCIRTCCAEEQPCWGSKNLPSAAAPAKVRPLSRAAAALGTAFRARHIPSLLTSGAGGVSDPSLADAGAPQGSRCPSVATPLAGRRCWGRAGEAGRSRADQMARWPWQRHGVGGPNTIGTCKVKPAASRQRAALRSPPSAAPRPIPGSFGVTPPGSIRHPQTQQSWINP